MILNFYLRKNQPLGTMRKAEIHNLRQMRISLKRRGVKNADQLDYNQAMQMLAKLVALEVRNK